MNSLKKAKSVQSPWKVKRKIFEEDSDNDLDMNISDFMSYDNSDDNNDTEFENDDALVLGNVDYSKIGDHVICEYRYQLKTSVIYYVGTVTKERDVEDDVELTFLKRVKKNENKIVKPSVEDTWTVHIDQIKAILPLPEFCGTNARTKGVIIFKVNFGNIDLR